MGATLCDLLTRYMELYQKLRDTIYKNRPANQYAFLERTEKDFINLELEEQCVVLNEILQSAILVNEPPARSGRTSRSLPWDRRRIFR